MPCPAQALETTGLTVLDIVKHAAKTIITTMTPKDRVAIVTFSSSAKILLDLTGTTDEGKKKAFTLIETMTPEDMTNLWEGLKTSMTILTNGTVAQPAPSPGGSAIVSVATAATNTLAVSRAVATHEEVHSIKRRLSSIFLLTDGVPNVNPPRGHLPMLKLFLESQDPSKVNFTINTAGFGYELDSSLLYEIACVGNGHFSFIPDPGMVGTNFVHAVANTYATYAQGLFVAIEVDEESLAKELKIEGAFNVTRSSWGVSVPMGTLQYGQTRDLIVKLPKSISELPLHITARCTPWNMLTEAKALQNINGAHLPPAEATVDPALKYHDHRLAFVDTIINLVDTKGNESTTYGGTRSGPTLIGDAQSKITTLIDKIKASLTDSNATATGTACADAQGPIFDLDGQVTLAVEDQASFKRWGAHYLLSLARSHQRQQCGNFKDPGLQIYGRDSVLFQASRDEIDKAFDDLPPPKPSAVPPTPPRPSFVPPTLPYNRFALGAGAAAGPGGAHRRIMGASSPYSPVHSMPPGPGGAHHRTVGPLSPTYSPVHSMSAYNSSATPCFAGHSIISLGKGRQAISTLRAGDKVVTPKGEATIAGIVKTVISGGRLPMCQLGEGLTITPWHPVYLRGWQFPTEVVDPTWVECDAIYSLILEENSDPEAHAVTIGGVRCVTMGHGVKEEEDIRSHPFLSKHDSVMAALARLPGLGVKEATGIYRDPETNLMAGFECVERLEASRRLESSTFAHTVVA